MASNTLDSTISVLVELDHEANHEGIFISVFILDENYTAVDVVNAEAVTAIVEGINRN